MKSRHATKKGSHKENEGPCLVRMYDCMYECICICMYMYPYIYICVCHAQGKGGWISAWAGIVPGVYNCCAVPGGRDVATP